MDFMLYELDILLTGLNLRIRVTPLVYGYVWL